MTSDNHTKPSATDGDGTGWLPWSHSWNVLAVAIFAVASALGLTITVFSFFVLHWAQEFNATRAELLLALSISYVGAACLLPFSGRAMDRYPMRMLGAVGIGCLCLGLLLTSFATAVWQLYVIYALVFSITEAVTGQLFAQTVAAKWFLRHRGLALGLGALGSSIGALIYPGLVAWLLDAFTWRETMQILAFGVASTVIPMILLVVKRPPGGAPRAGARSGDPGWTAGRVLKDKSFWIMVAAIVPLLEAATGLTSNFVPLAHDLGIDATSAAFLISLWSVVMIGSKVGLGFIADYFDQRVLFAIAWVPSMAGLVLLALADSYASLFAAAMIFGVGCGGIMPLVGMLISRNFGVPAFGTVIGLFYLCLRSAAIAGPLAAWVRDVTGSYNGFWLGVALFSIATAIPLFFLRERCPQKSDQPVVTVPAAGASASN